MAFQPYPKAKTHLSGKTAIVKNAEEEAALGGGWAAGSAAEFASYQGPMQQGPQHNPTKWVDSWSVENFSDSVRNKIKAQLLQAHATFWRSPDDPTACTEAMKRAFSGIARVLFDAGILSEQHLAREIPELVWDSAIAGGWWRLASETREPMFQGQLGHYWVFRDDSRDWNMLFGPETAEWQAQLLEASVPISNPAESPTARGRKKRTLPAAPPSTSASSRSWRDVRISFLSEERVQIWIAGQAETRNYAEMGFSDQRNGTPSKSWILLRTLAQNQGLIPVTGRVAKEWAAIEKQIQRTRKLLQSHFGISEDPLPFEKGVGYQLRCEIECARSFDK